MTLINFENLEFLFALCIIMEFIFAWVFMVLCWNLMGRSNSVSSINFQHIDWTQDCMTITYASSKTDKKGTKEGNTKHVYANPLEPAICPILAMAVYLFCYARNGQNSNLFPGEHASDRFNKVLLRMLNVIPDIASIMGASKEVSSIADPKKLRFSLSIFFRVTLIPCC